MAKTIMRYKSFLGPVFNWPFQGYRKPTRERAQAFMNMIGAEKVVSVVEHTTPFCVVVRYRDDGLAENQPRGEREKETRVFLARSEEK